MNREIKFRVWNAVDKAFVTDVSLFNAVRLVIPHVEVNVVAFQLTEVEWLDSPIFIYLQFTGLKDRNEKEIFEGDVVQWFGYGEDSDWMEKTPQGKDVVTMARFPVYWLENEECEFGEGLVNWDDCEVIGNRYENPELLEPVAPSTIRGATDSEDLVVKNQSAL